MTGRFQLLHQRWPGRRLACGAAALLVLAAAPVALAQRKSGAAEDARVEWRLPVARIQVGEPLQVQLVCHNIDNPQAPEVAAVDGLAVVLLNPVPQHFSSTTIVNGQATRQATDTWVFEVTADRPGQFTLPAAVVRSGRKSHIAGPATLTVIEAPAAAGQDGDQLIFARIEASPASLYLSESIRAALVVGVRKIQADGQPVDVNLWNNILQSGSLNLSAFRGVEPTVSEQRLVDSEGRRHLYVMYRLDTVIRADRAGDFAVGPVFIAWNYPIEVRARRDFFSLSGRSLEVVQARRVTARAEAVTVEVKAPPSQGRPAFYDGAIGRFTWDVTARPAEVELGQPVTLTIELRGEPIDGVAAPDLGAQPELVSRFDFRKDELVGEQRQNAKTYRQALFPKQIGEQTIPPLRWSYFDTQREEYVTLASAAIPISVNPVSSPLELLPAAPSGAADGDDPRAQGAALTTAKGGLAANYVDPSEVLADHEVSFGWGWGAGLALPPVACLAAALVQRRRRRFRDDTALARRHRAFRRALTSLSAAQTVEGCAAALTAYVTDRFNLPPGALTAAEAAGVLSAHGVPPPLVDEVGALLERVEAARYAGGALEDEPLDPHRRTVREWMERIESG